MKLTARTETKTEIIKESEDVVSQLTTLHPTLDSSILLEANLTGYSSRVEVTPAHAPTAAGTLHWHSFIAALRLGLLQRGWTRINNKNCPLVLSPDESVMIAVMTGDVDTGRELGRPTNQGVKGAVLSESISHNIQMELDVSGGTQLWVVLYHVEQDAKGDKEIRTELSLPSTFTAGKISGWTKRILLDSIDLTADPEYNHALQTDAIELDIGRKTDTK